MTDKARVDGGQDKELRLDTARVNDGHGKS